MKKAYQLEYSGASRMTIEIDHSIFTQDKFKECSDFWSSKPTFEEWLKLVYLVALRDSVASWSPLKGLREGTEEGFPKMDGSTGIRIIDFDDFEFDDFEIDLTELA
ncbi:DUF2528 family protein [Burkholderia pseudomallei]|uniref:DUF2528 family protein n=1 Tax=Burkholderia pseudomallei TaxID=28450 RepID=UPI00100AA3E2|nr:DUF2528 family protein [Burkholderia pseudomallei]